MRVTRGNAWSWRHLAVPCGSTVPDVMVPGTRSRDKGRPATASDSAPTSRTTGWRHTKAPDGRGLDRKRAPGPPAIAWRSGELARLGSNRRPSAWEAPRRRPDSYGIRRAPPGTKACRNRTLAARSVRRLSGSLSVRAPDPGSRSAHRGCRCRSEDARRAPEHRGSVPPRRRLTPSRSPAVGQPHAFPDRQEAGVSDDRLRLRSSRR